VPVKWKDEQMSTLNRGRLLKLARAGKLVCVDSYHYDETSGETRLKSPLPVRIKLEYGDYLAGHVSLTEHDFQSSSGCASLSDDGQTATLYVHSNRNYDFRMADGSGFVALNTAVIVIDA
jgi:hypothetical protein